MKKSLITIGSALILFCSCNKAVDNEIKKQPGLAFEEGKFRVVQFTDFHLKPGAETTDTTFAVVRAVVENEKPGLAVITGDIVTYEPATQGWQQVAALFEELNTPFTVTMGNHDAEYLTKDSIYNILMKSPMYVGGKGPAEINGCGNSAIDIAGADGKPAAVIYCFDSNDYQPDKKLGEYDWIHFNQIAWHREEATRRTEANGGTPLPSLAFFHIPLQEYAEVVDDDKTYGFKDEGAGCPADLNTGLYASLIETDDVMGVFAGHDHNNDFVGLDRYIALGYGRSTGAQAYGDHPLGARVFDLYEGQRKFDTWIATKEGREHAWHYPSGLNDEEAAAMAYHEPLEYAGNTNGVRYTYFEGPFRHISEIKPEMKKCSGTAKNFDISNPPADDHFAYRFTGLIKIPETGVYRFYTHSDDGSVLWIDGEKVVDNDGGHSARRREGKIALKKGYYPIEVEYFDNYMGQELEVGFSSVAIPETLIPDSLLYY